MSHCMRILLVAAIAMALLPPITLAQRPGPAPGPTPSPPPSSGPPSRSPNPNLPSSDVTQPRDDYVMFLRGRVATNDGAPVPNDMLIERVCNNRVRQQVYASLHGDFSMELGSRTDSFPEGSADSTSPFGTANRDPSQMGISRRELTNCELRASASGFRSRVINLMEVDTHDSNIDVGVIVVQRGIKAEGATVSAEAYKAPKDARKAYEKGLQAEKNGKLAEAHKYFETAVKIHPTFTNAWFRLGSVLQRENQDDGARKAYTQAMTINTRFLAPYLSLAVMSARAGNWREVLDLTGHILDLDPLSRAAATNYILDLDPANYVDAYFYNALANYKLNKMEDAEKSALKAEHLDLFTHFPQLHLILADTFARKNNYAGAIAEMQTYVALVPNAADSDQVRKRLANLEKVSSSPPVSEKPEPR